MACASFVMTFSRMKLALSLLYFIIQPASKASSEVQFFKETGTKITLNATSLVGFRVNFLLERETGIKTFRDCRQILFNDILSVKRERTIIEH